jgi:hypothetical protein
MKDFVQRIEPKLIQIMGPGQCSSQEHEEHYLRIQKIPRYKTSHCQTQNWHIRPLKQSIFL